MPLFRRRLHGSHVAGRGSTTRRSSASPYATNVVLRTTSSGSGSSFPAAPATPARPAPAARTGSPNSKRTTAGSSCRESSRRPYTIGGIDDDTVMPANAATQIQVSSVVMRWNSSLWTLSGGWSTSANSRTNGLPSSTPVKRDEEDPGVAQRLHPPLHEPIAQREGQHRQHQKCCNSAYFERAPRPALDAADHERQHRDRQRHEHGGGEWDVADKHPVDDPRREAQQDSHEGSV